MNEIRLLGVVSSAPRTGFAGKTPLCEFDIYVSSPGTGRDGPPKQEAFTVAAFGALSEALLPLIQPGDVVLVTGRLRQYTLPSTIGGPRVQVCTVSANSVTFAPASVAAKLKQTFPSSVAISAN